MPQPLLRKPCSLRSLRRVLLVGARPAPALLPPGACTPSPLQAPPVPLPPPWHPGWRTPSARVGRKGAPTSQEDYELILLEVNTFNRGLEEVGGSQWREVLGREAAAAAAVARKKRGGG